MELVIKFNIAGLKRRYAMITNPKMLTYNDEITSSHISFPKFSPLNDFHDLSEFHLKMKIYRTVVTKLKRNNLYLPSFFEIEMPQ